MTVGRSKAAETEVEPVAVEAAPEPELVEIVPSGSWRGIRPGQTVSTTPERAASLVARGLARYPRG